MKDKLTEEMIEGARIANAIPEEQEFWREVAERLDVENQSPEVAPREKSEH